MNLPYREVRKFDVYGFNVSTNSKSQSPHAAQVFGTNTNAFELLVLKLKNNGP
ncbi:hypothetical protein M378DRAFT_19480 [Amanita muscaria Koide BX008]|uniref:Uncharacterized protein n=1 Tax=Amanita muscaria (strain Koide BX008) TaxID=946122 RepID=A0A0C2RUD6_AMAMK|nr:hypothetical protein M378DRAFT_19480 [Amanita muscaria Koide BX008]